MIPTKKHQHKYYSNNTYCLITAWTFLLDSLASIRGSSETGNFTVIAYTKCSVYVSQKKIKKIIKMNCYGIYYPQKQTIWPKTGYSNFLHPIQAELQYINWGLPWKTQIWVDSVRVE